MKYRNAPAAAAWLVLISASVVYSQQYNTSGGWVGSDTRRAASTTDHLGVGVVGDAAANDRFQIRADGLLSWGSGSAVPDVDLYRSSADTLFTPDSIEVGGSGTFTGALSASNLSGTNTGDDPGGSAVVLDLGNDGDDSTDLEKIITTGDDNDIFTHADDELTIDLTNAWPEADALAAAGANCAAGSYPLGVDVAGAVEDCTNATTEIDTAISTHGDVADDHHVKTVNASELSAGTIPAARVGAAHIDALTEVVLCAGEGQASVGAIDDGDMLVGDNGNGDYRDVQMSGDATMDETGDVTLESQVKSMYWGAVDISADGAQCADAAQESTIAGPELYVIVCTDNDAGIIGGSTVMPDSWDAGTVTLEIAMVQTGAETLDVHGDVEIQCRGLGEAIADTWSGEVALDLTQVGGSAVDTATTAPITPAGTCEAGDMLIWQYSIDATGTDATVATNNIIGVKMEYTSDIGD